MSLPLWHGIALGWPVAPGQAGVIGIVVPVPVPDPTDILALIAAAGVPVGFAVLIDDAGNPLVDDDGKVLITPLAS